MSNRDLRWAAKTLLEFNNVPATPKYIDAFCNPSGNEQWIKAIIKGASPVVGSMTSPYYQQAIDILKENGIPVDIYRVG